MLKTTSFMNKRSLRGGSNQNGFARTPAKDQMSIDLLNQNENKGRNYHDLE